MRQTTRWLLAGWTMAVVLLASAAALGAPGWLTVSTALVVTLVVGYALWGD